MNELVKAVLALALSTAAAVRPLGTALHLWPDTGQLAYGNSLPYLKVKFDRPVNAVRFWVEDFGGVPYERVWLYVNGQLAASGGPGTNATAKCGDEVAAIVKYYSGTKKLEGRILCAEPIKAPERTQTWDEYSKVILSAYQATTGDLDRTGLPVNITGYIKCDKQGDTWVIYSALVNFIATEPNVVICVGWTCSQSVTIDLQQFPGLATNTYVYIYKIPDTVVASQYLGGARVAFRLAVGSYWVQNNENLAIYVNGTVVSRCNITAVTITETYAVYRKPNASGVYLVRIRLSGSNTVLEGSINVYQTPNNKVGFEIYANPNKKVSPSSSGGQCAKDETAVNVNGEIVCVQYNKNAVEQGGPFDKFLQTVQNDSNTGNAFLTSVKSMSDTSYNVPRVFAGYYTYTYTVMLPITTSYTMGLSFGTLMPASLGVIFANAVLSSGIQMPVIETPNETNLPPTSFFVAYRGR
jgi:hypothetical protein